MKHFTLLFFLISIFVLKSTAQEIRTTAAYKYEVAVGRDLNNGKEKQRFPVTGVIVFSQAAGEDFITFTIGNKVSYNGMVKSKQVHHNGKVTYNIYVIIQEIQGYKVPIQIFEIYDTEKSTYIPDEFQVVVCNRDTGKPVQLTTYECISRVQ